MAVQITSANRHTKGTIKVRCWLRAVIRSSAARRDRLNDGCADKAAVGVIEVGAYADILLVDGDPTADAAILADYENNIDFIMKDGVIYENTLD